MKGYGKPQRSQRKFNSLCPPKEIPLKEITGNIIVYAIEVHSNLWPGLLESVYKEALAYEFELRGIKFERQKEIMPEYALTTENTEKEIKNKRVGYFSLCTLWVKKNC